MLIFDLFRFIVDELINLHRGQGMELFWRDSLTCPTEDEYVSRLSILELSILNDVFEDLNG